MFHINITRIYISEFSYKTLAHVKERMYVQVHYRVEEVICKAGTACDINFDGISNSCW